MVQKKKSSKQLSAASSGPIPKKVAENLPRKIRGCVDHWAFLDEIEAPTWADLAVECHSPYEDKDDDWFHITHPFHQLSAQQLISTFSHSGESCINSAFDIRGPTSPKLPPSVSKSRGKDFKKLKHEPIVCSLTLTKKNQGKSMSGKSSFINVVSNKAVRNKALDGRVKDSLNFKSDSVAESTLTETAALGFSRSVSGFSDKKNSPKSVSFGTGESDSISTVTFEANKQPASELLSALRVSIRKSFVTRQASRVVIKGMGQSEDQKSSPSKSSVGSTSQRGSGGPDLKITDNKDKTPDSRNMMMVSQVPAKKLNRGYANMVAAAQAQSTSRNSKLGVSEGARKATDHRKHTRVNITGRDNERAPPPAPKKSVQASGISQSQAVHGGKENQAGRNLGVTSRTRTTGAEGAVQNQKLLKRELDQKRDRTKVVGPGEISGKVKKSTRVAETVYFR